MADQQNPLLVEYDQAIHQVTHTFRAEYPTRWFEVKKTSCVEREKGKAPKAPKTKDPIFARYLDNLNTVTQQFNSQHHEWLFSYSGAKVTVLMRGGSITHNTRPLAAGEVAHVAGK